MEEDNNNNKLRCDTVINHAETCRLCKVYLRSEIKFLYFIIVILSGIVIFYVIKEREREGK
jgi:hypothetical protein